MLERLLQKFIRTIKEDNVFKGDLNIRSLSTLQKIVFPGKKDDNFYLQTQIRLCAHILEKDLTIHSVKPLYQNYYHQLSKQLSNYHGSNTPTIRWARDIHKKYKSKYGL